MNGYGFEHGFGHGFGLLFWILILGLVVVAVVLIIRGFEGGNTVDKTPARNQSALEVLEERYARGEIEHDEFVRRKRDLQDRKPDS